LGGVIPYAFVSIAIVAAIILVVYFINLYHDAGHLGRRELNNAIQLLLNRLNTKTAAIETGVEVASSKAEAALSSVDQLYRRAEEQKAESAVLRGSLEDVLGTQVVIAGSLNRMHQKVLALVGGQERIQGHVRRLSEGYRELLPETEKPTISAVLPLSREVTTARLTPTEMLTLRTLASSGAKTASEIREVIGKTREHSARLMKKLYIEGYIERDTSNLPYAYKLSEKIRKSFEFSSDKHPVENNTTNSE